MRSFRSRGRGRGGSGGGHDGGAGMRWLLTYSDLITLLMAFFVILFAMSSVEQKKFQMLKTTLQSALSTGAGSNIVLPYSGDKLEPPLLDQLAAENDEFQQMINNIKAKSPDPRQVGFLIDERGLTIRFLDSVLFDRGQAELRADANGLMNAVGANIKTGDHYIRIEGHTDNLPIQTMQFPSNWELSSARSIAVTRFMINGYGLDPRRLSSLGFAEYHPLYPNTTEENRARNRRVDIVILRNEKTGSEIDDKKIPANPGAANSENANK